MAIKITRGLNLDDVTEGFGTIKSGTTENDSEMGWNLPGGLRVKTKEEALLYAKRMDALIRRNMQRTGKSLI